VGFLVARRFAHSTVRSSDSHSSAGAHP